MEDIIAISDLEGFDINLFLPNCKCDDNNCVKCNNLNIILCGDMIDSTGSDSSILEKKIYNLRNILKIIKSNNIELVLGNRDLNKIKLILLAKLKLPINDSNYHLNFNLGILNFSEYDELKKKIIASNTNNEDCWKESMDNWDIFWDNKKSKGESKNFNIDRIFIDRFNDIFTDSMGAKGLLNSISLELGINTIDDDYKAFIVFLVFNSMLQVSRISNYDVDFKQTFKNAYFCRGWYYELLNKGKVCSIFTYEESKKKYIFSHGGITKDLINNIEDINIIEAESLKENTAFFKVGGSGSSINFENSNIFNEKINKINRLFRNKINEAFYFYYNCRNNDSKNNDSKKSIDFILSMVAEYKFPVESKEISSGIISPIMPGFTTLVGKEQYFFCNDYTVIQIFGHKPIGYAATIYAYSDNDKKTILVNLDNSNSFFNSVYNYIDNTDPNKFTKSYFAIDQNGNGIVKSIISLKLKNFDNKVMKLKEFSDQKFNKLNEDSYTIIYSKSFEEEKQLLNIDNLLINITQNIDEIDTSFSGYIKLNYNVEKKQNESIIIVSKNGNQFRAFNGIIEEKYYIFSVVHPDRRQVALYILTKEDFNKYISIDESQSGGDYKLKYLKYKKKYLMLKQKF